MAFFFYIYATVILRERSRRKLLFLEEKNVLSIKNPTVGRILVSSRLGGHKIRLARTLFALFGAN